MTTCSGQTSDLLSRARLRDPDNELFDSACELLAAASRLHAAAPIPGGEPAITATLGCLETALTELAGACRTLAIAEDPAPDAGQHEMEQRFGHLARLMDETAVVCAQARRSLVGGGLDSGSV